MSERTPDLPNTRHAGTLIVARDDPAGGAPEFLMVERSANMAFAGGAMVFPGGAVDEADRIFAGAMTLFADIDDAAGRIAAIRETIEESGLAVTGSRRALSKDVGGLIRDSLRQGKALAAIVQELGVEFDFSRIIPFARWCPPIGREIRRFDTRFYITVISGGEHDLTPDGTETVHLGWHKARDVLDLANEGKAKIIFPTRRNLERLAQCPDTDALVAHATAHPVTLITPWVEKRDGADHLCIPEGLGYPVTSEPTSTVQRG